MGFVSHIMLLMSLIYTEGLLNSLYLAAPSSVFKKLDTNKVSTIHTRTTIFQAGNYGDSDEDLFISLFNEKQNNEGDIDTTSSFEGAGVPIPSLNPENIIPLLMTALEHNNIPVVDAGLVSMWEFASDTTKFIFQNNITEFIESCHETATEFPTSFYGVAMNGQSWDIETEINSVGGKDGWIATQVMKTISSDGRVRRWQWELRKNKRPPCLGCWKVENIASSDRNGDFEATDRGTGWSD